MTTDATVVPPSRDALLADCLAAWTAMWNSYDLDQVAQRFVTDSSVIYFSSETPGVSEGFDRLVAHHRAFGFVPGGKATANRLWLDVPTIRWRDDTATVFTLWYFQRGGSDQAQRGPVTFIAVPDGSRYRIAHAHFANYS